MPTLRYLFISKYQLLISRYSDSSVNFPAHYLRRGSQLNDERLQVFDLSEAFLVDGLILRTNPPTVSQKLFALASGVEPGCGFLCAGSGHGLSRGGMIDRGHKYIAAGVATGLCRGSTLPTDAEIAAIIAAIRPLDVGRPRHSLRG